MTLRALRGAGAWVPAPIYGASTIGTSVYLIDASGEKAVAICRCPRAGTLDRFDFLVGVVTNSPDNGLRASFQGVNPADGQNDGTILGATNNAAVTYPHTVTTGWKSTNFGETVTVTRGQLIACVIDIPSFTAGDSVTITHYPSGTSHLFPYGISAAGKTGATIPIVALHYTDGYAFLTPFVSGFDTVVGTAFNVATSGADEWGLAFQVPWPCTLDAIAATLLVTAGADFEVIVYDSADVALATLTSDGDVAGSNAAAGLFVLVLPTAVTLVANATYRVTVRPTTTNAVSLYYATFQSAALMSTMEGGDNFYMTSRLNQAAPWTDYNAGTFRRPRMHLQLSALDDAVGGANPLSGKL